MKKHFNKNLIMTEKKKKNSNQLAFVGYMKNSLKMRK